MGLLRILLAICVFCSHARRVGGLPWLDGDLAVEMFFVISGFYMQLVLSTRYTPERLGSKWRGQFYQARYFRLLPAYLLGALLVTGTSLLRPSSGLLQSWKLVADLPNTLTNLFFKAYLFFTNVTMLFQDAAMFLSAGNGRIHWSLHPAESAIHFWQALAIPQAWSIGVELSFYLLAPYLLTRRSRWLVSFAAASLALKAAVLLAYHLPDPWTFRFLPFELGYFLCGALAYRYRRSLDGFVPKGWEKYAVYPIALALTMVWVPASAAIILYPALLVCLLPFLFRATSKFRLDRAIGELSYPFYIFHLLAISLAEGAGRSWLRGNEEAAAWVGLALALSLSVAGLALETRFIEPWRSRLAERRPDRSTIAAPQSEPAALPRLAAFFCLLAALVWGFDTAIASGLRRTSASVYGASNQIMEGRINAQVAITGSSRAASHYDPKVIQRTTGLTTFNLGRNGSQTDMQIAVLKAYLKHNRQPAVVIHNLDAFTFQTTREVYNPAQYVPYLYEDEIYRPLRRIDPDIWKSRYLPLYGYVAADMSFAWTLGVKAYLPSTHRNDAADGFDPRPGKWSGDFERFKAGNRGGVHWEIEPEGVRLMEELVRLCQDRGIRLLLVYSPEYREMQVLTSNRREIFEAFHRLASGPDTAFWDYSGWRNAGDTNYFNNSQHLNAEGAELFSRDVAMDLNEYLAKPALTASAKR